MAITIPSIANPYDPTTPLTNAYAWIAGLYLDLNNSQGRVTLNVHPKEEAWQGVPVRVIAVSLGQSLTTGGQFPTLTDLMTDPEFAQAYQVIGAKLYALIGDHLDALVPQG